MPSAPLNLKLNDVYLSSVSKTAPGLRDARLSNCCGITELDFNELMYRFENLSVKERTEKWVRIQAASVIAGSGKEDGRLLVVGVPVKVVVQSQYNSDFYTLLRKVLKRFGFRETAPYKNQNSGNTIVAMVGQRPD